jgi:hypothetical protein
MLLLAFCLMSYCLLKLRGSAAHVGDKFLRVMMAATSGCWKFCSEHPLGKVSQAPLNLVWAFGAWMR